MDKKRQYHEIDNNIKIDFEVPEIFQEILDAAEESDLNEDGNYYNWADAIETFAKNLYVEGAISGTQWQTLSRRYKQW